MWREKSLASVGNQTPALQPVARHCTDCAILAQLKALVLKHLVRVLSMVVCNGFEGIMQILNA
jgi:hypothetical protein